MSSRAVTVLVFCILAGLLSGCVSTDLSQSVRSSTMFQTFDDFRPGPKGGADLVWSDRQITDYESFAQILDRYDSIMLDRIWVVVDENNDRLSKEKISTLAAYMIDKMTSALGKRFSRVSKPSVNTLRLTIVVRNIETPNPILSVTSSILPVGIGISTVSKIVTGEHTNVGGATVEMLLSDSKTNIPLMAAIDRYTGRKDLGTMVDSLDDAKEAIDYWVERLSKTLAGTELKL